MLFNSSAFLIFFPIVVTVYFIMPKKLKNFWLLICSYYFYMCWRAEYALLILFSTVTTYFCSLFIGEAKKEWQRKFALILSIFVNLAVLFVFKYFNFFAGNIAQLFSSFGIAMPPLKFSLLLPVGISFYTFQALGYAIDVYRKKTNCEKNFFTYALFVSFFPQLVAGPIERSGNLLPQFYQKHTFDYTRVKNGLIQMAYGFFKKVVIADGLAVFVTLVYSQPQNYAGLPLILATVFFAFQIYCDFSGYSDIAIGAARVLGFNLMRNFAHPYFAKNISEFWRRWHISLSSWFMDYVYIPLGGSRKGFARTIINLSITFLISGLWHGANWTFIVWGALNGIFIVSDKIFAPIIEKVQRTAHIKQNGFIANAVGVSVTFTLICFSWIFFRAENMSSAVYIINNLTNNLAVSVSSVENFKQSLALIGFFDKNGIALAGSVLFMILIEFWERNTELVEKLKTQNFVVRWVFYYTIMLLILFFGNFGKSPFVYFDF